ncbi:MAG TPA: O-antigen ligase family protein [Actinomycetota bacterium]|jgi:hypothetical protein
MRRSNPVPRAKPPNGAVLVPAGIGAVGLGVVAAEAPLVGLGLVGLAVLTMLPWGVQWVLLLFSSTVNRLGFDVAGATIRPSQVLLIPLAIRVFTMTRASLRPRWRLPEYTLIAFVGLQFATSYLNAQSRKESFFSAGLLMLGALAYFTTFESVVTRKRLIFAARIVLLTSVLSAAAALLALFAHSLFGTVFGVSGKSVPSAAGASAAVGLSQEHDILGSASGAAAVMFFLLRRESNPILSRRWATAGFVVCFIAMVTSLTRAAWIGFAIAMLAAVIFHRPRIRAGDRTLEAAMTMLAVALVGAGLFWLVRDLNTSSATTGYLGAIQGRSSDLLNISSGSGANRVLVAQTALQDWTRSPIIGLGTNSYGQRHTILIGRAGAPGYIGDLYLRTLYDSGIVGLALLLLFYGDLLWPRRFLKVSPGDLAPVARAFLFGMIVMAIGFAATDASFQIWAWIVLGMVRASWRMAEDQYLELTKPVRAPRRANGGRALPLVPAPAGPAPRMLPS